MIFSLALTGPTASGKTELSLVAAELLGCEIICCDSMQIYKGMNIGTAKATEAEMSRVPHHMVDIINPDENFSASAYRELAIPIARGICERGKIPLFVGGTGLYLDTVKRRYTPDPPAADAAYREKILEKIRTEEEKIELWEKLLSVDKISAEKTHYNNVRRVIRALEIYEKTGKPKSYFDEQSRLPNEEILVKHITIDFHNRDNLYRRIDLRVEEMFDAGLAEEVKSLTEEGLLPKDSTAAGAIGYKELIEGERLGLSCEEIKEIIKQATRNYAKRQLTWFRNSPEANVIYRDDPQTGKIKRSEDFFAEFLSLATEAVKAFR